MARIFPATPSPQIIATTSRLAGTDHSQNGTTMYTKPLINFLLVSTLAVPSLGQTTSAANGKASSAATTKSASTLGIHDGDLLEISIAGAPEYHYEVRVSPNGDFSLPMAGKLAVDGLSTSQAEAALNQRLAEKGFFNDPQSSVFVKEYATEGISVLGEVQKPGIYPLLGKRTLLDAISAAGGTTEKAGRAVTITHRGHVDTPQIVKLSHDESDHTLTNIELQSGDTVVVSKAGVVYVVGDVKDPTGIVLENPRLTVLQALALAHGTNPTAKLGGAKVIRNTANGTKEIRVPLDKILSTQAPDLPLLADDILFVPNSAARSATRRGLEAMVQAVTGMAVYGRL
jgi:polysaccharide export outer membrane protein